MREGATTEAAESPIRCRRLIMTVPSCHGHVHGAGRRGAKRRCVGYQSSVSLGPRDASLLDYRTPLVHFALEKRRELRWRRGDCGDAELIEPALDEGVA